MEKITHYQAVASPRVDGLTSKVNDLISRGYQPLGGITITKTYSTMNTEKTEYAQAMVKYESKKTKNVTVKD